MYYTFLFFFHTYFLLCFIDSKLMDRVLTEADARTEEGPDTQSAVVKATEHAMFPFAVAHGYAVSLISTTIKSILKML